MKKKYFVQTFCLLILIAGLVMANSGGPPDGYTGAPGEGNCSYCHVTSNPSNAAFGGVGVYSQDTYEPNEIVVINIDAIHLYSENFGFEATVLDAGNNAVGSLVSPDPTRTQISTSTGREYIKQTSAGTGVNPGSSWTIHWVAPATSAGPVTIYVSGTCANFDGIAPGFLDYVYPTSFTINPTSCCVGFRGNANGSPDDVIDIADLIYLVAYAFQGGDPPPCPDEADVNASGGANPIDISDLIYLVTYMFQSGPDPADCP